MKPASPFRWQEEIRPSIFAKDPHFRSRHKAGLINDDNGLKYKQFGTAHLSKVPLSNKLTNIAEYNPGDKLFIKHKENERNV